MPTPTIHHETITQGRSFVVTVARLSPKGSRCSTDLVSNDILLNKSSLAFASVHHRSWVFVDIHNQTLQKYAVMVEKLFAIMAKHT